MAIPFILPTPLFRREFRRNIFLLEFYFKFISILQIIKELGIFYRNIFLLRF
jgi:hypothetical protein